MDEPMPARPSTDWITLDDDDIARLLPFGTVSDTTAGQTLFTAGDASPSFHVVLEGAVDLLSGGADGTPQVVTTHTAKQFLGEFNLLLELRPVVSAVVVHPGSVLVIERAGFDEFMRTLPDIADQVFAQFEARRKYSRQSETISAAIQIIGTRFSAEAMALRVFASRSQVPHSWVDLDELDEPEAYLAALGATAHDVPLVITPTAQLTRPTTAEFANFLGLEHIDPPDHVNDVTVIGLGPAGLAAAVVAVAEGLSAVCLEGVAVGGQAAASSRIENYLGFPNGVSGEQLVEHASTQAQRLGARLVSPCQVTGLRTVGDLRVVDLADGTEVASRTVVIASGARYRRLEVDDLERFEGAGVYYATTELERRACRGHDVIVVGGGNSAGQAALSLAKTCSSVSLVVRRDNLEETMSHYLVARIEQDPRIRLLLSGVVRALDGDDAVTSATVENTATGERETVPCRGVFCFIGAVAATDWLDGTIALDRRGFVQTGRNLPDEARDIPEFAERHPLPFETSMPGVFAAGDVRSASMKRVAAAVGEGSTVVRSILEFIGARV